MSPKFESIGNTFSSEGSSGTQFTGACDCGTWFKSVAVKKNEVTCAKCKVTRTV